MPSALLSVHDKTGLVEFAAGLRALGWRLIASGGTARVLREGGPVIDVADYTGSPELLGGRVKTLHPALHGGLLARPTESDRAELVARGWDYIELVAVNLYPFEETVARPGPALAEAVANIDIGGVALMRAAAKNHARVTLVSDPDDYGAVMAELRAGGVGAATRARLAVKAFARTADYDSAIAAYLRDALTPGQPEPRDSPLRVVAYPSRTLRYGENPHQAAVLYAYSRGVGPLGGEVLQGKELSYNNLLDLDSAWKAALSFERPTVCIVKHLSPCGVASADALAEAFRAALACDPMSAFGGVVAANRALDGATAEALGDLFAECLAAPGVSSEARTLLARKKNCRVVELPDTTIEPRHELRSITRGLLWQERDSGDPAAAEWRVVSRREPTAAEWTALRFAWKVCQHVRSNAIVLARGEATVGIGGGQPNRVDCARIATQRAGERARGAAMASDAFFPFPDSIEVAAASGVTAAVHPGGSMRDAESVRAADAAGMALVVTGVRHFRH